MKDISPCSMFMYHKMMLDDESPYEDTLLVTSGLS